MSKYFINRFKAIVHGLSDGDVTPGEYLFYGNTYVRLYQRLKNV